MSATQFATASSTPWKPWSIPVNPAVLRRRLCGYLNKLTQSTFDSVSQSIVQLAILVEKTDDPDVLDVFSRTIFQRGMSENIYTDLYVAICQKIVDETEGERSKWRKVDVFHIGNPMACFETSVRLLAQFEFDRIIANDVQTLPNFMRFVGGLVVEAILLPNDVHAMLDDLSLRATTDDQFTLALSHFLSPVLHAFNASQLLDMLGIHTSVECILADERISSRTRYILMSILDKVVYPQPQDVFASSRQRIEAYGLDSDDSSDAEFSDGAEETGAFASSQLWVACKEHARYCMLRRDVEPAMHLFQRLRPEHRYVFVSCLVSTVLASGDASDATFAGTVLGNQAIQELCREEEAVTEGFAQELDMLEDTSIDVPKAYILVATILHASALDLSSVETLSSSVLRSRPNVKDKLLDTYLTLRSSSSAVQSEEESDSA
ncbi:hypothetical protein K474DRAFT_1592343 [Panus rudis PR-1116 ss-1]|nr:hypothetical protein K474DRAFT_1592343 [Panus rudis PR-1116 ss-1]